ncbi:MAG: hypothetical protein HY420_01515 [Candidatus Kerfeldbacteria bacterium]|nr:hypothetical protein [Candidatus Kerfeldbacteria bacterium]
MNQSRTSAARLVAWYRLHRGWLGYLGIFSLAFLLFAYSQYQPIFADPDSFYHAKAAVLLRDGRFTTTFAALPFTTLAHSYADQHFLYHLLLVPFVSVIDPLIGLKLATVVLGSLMALIFYWFLRRWNVRWAFVTTILLLLVNPFMFRMNLAKASSLSIALLLIGLATAFSYRPKLLAVIAFAYVWFYGGFSLLLLSVLVFAVISALHRRYLRREDGNTFLQRVRALLGRAFRHGRVRQLNFQLAAAAVIGTIVGLIVNPFFPSNIRFYFDQAVRIGLVNYQKAIGVGGEWYPYKFIELVANTVIVAIPLVVALVLFILYFRKQSSRSMTLFVLWLFFFVLTLKSRRYIEYEVPFGLLFSAFSLNDSLQGFHWRQFWRETRQKYFRRWAGVAGAAAIATYAAILLPTVVIRDFISQRHDLANGFRLGLFEQESRWIVDHGNPGAVVFHSDWDEFPILYYYNSSSRYIAGLDPTFLYLENKDRYWQWANVTMGRETGDVYQIVRGTFNADFVLVERDHTAMDSLIKNDERFTLAFDGPDAKIYTVQ